MNRHIRLAGAALPLLLSGCGLLGRSEESAPAGEGRPQEITMRVINENFYDATIYAVDQGGYRRRLGVVGGLKEDTFRFRWSSIDLSVEIRLLSVGTTQTYSLPVDEGDELELRITPDLHRRIPPSS